MMELAIKVMLESVVEPRIDGKPLPKVGAVLVKADGTVQTACRGELRHGDHAEYTLLDKKNRTERLDGSTLYATLEPCRTKSRKHPKLGCAERIVAARIKELYIDTTDPDPKVKGSIEYLQSEGVTVHMFGLKSIRRRAQETGLPLPTYTFEDPYLVLRVYRTANAANELLPENIRNELVEAEMKGWQWLRSQGRAKSSQYAQALGLDERSARRHLNRFVELGLARRSGAAKATCYEAVGAGHVSGSGRR